MKASKKPIVIDYFPVSNPINEGEIKEWVEDNGESFSDWFIPAVPGITGLKVKTKEGSSYDVTDKDVIIRGPYGEYYPNKKEIFHATYDLL